MLAVVWHFWIGVVLAIGAVATVAGLAAQYLTKVQKTRYPGRGQ